MILRRARPLRRRGADAGLTRRIPDEPLRLIRRAGFVRYSGLVRDAGFVKDDCGPAGRFDEFLKLVANRLGSGRIGARDRLKGLGRLGSGSRLRFGRAGSRRILWDELVCHATPHSSSMSTVAGAGARPARKKSRT